MPDIKPWATPGEINATLPRADPKDVQAVVDRWKRIRKIAGRASDADRGAFRAWAIRTRDHWFVPDVFSPAAWSVEDVRVLNEKLDEMENPQP